MVIDTSAVLAILFLEPEAEAFAQAVEKNQVRLISAANVLEAGIIVETRRGEPGGREFDLFIHKAQLEIVAVDQHQAEIARAAYRKYGKGIHPAKLNFGNCFSYALAKATGEPLLYKGQDFSATDIEPVRY